MGSQSQSQISFFRLKTFFLSIFLGLGSQKFLGIVWDLVEFLGLGLNSENFGIGTGIEFEKFWDWDSYFLNVGLGLGFIFSEPGIGIILPTPGHNCFPMTPCHFLLDKKMIIKFSLIV